MRSIAGSTRTHRQAGFTYTELAMVTAIGLLVGLALATVYRATSDSVGTIYGQGTLQLHLNTAMNAITNDIRLASSAPVVGGGGTTLTIFVPSLDAARQPMNPQTDTILYELIGGAQLRRTLTPNALSSRVALQQILATNLNSTMFTLSTPVGQTRPVVGVAMEGHLYSHGQEITNGKVSVTLPVNGQIIGRNL